MKKMSEFIVCFFVYFIGWLACFGIFYLGLCVLNLVVNGYFFYKNVNVEVVCKLSLVAALGITVARLWAGGYRK